MNDNQISKENPIENKSLMRKTKAQLIEIIFRKDNIEKALRTDIKQKENELVTIKNRHNSLKSCYLNIKRDYQDICDEKASIECELNIKIRKQKVVIYALIILLVFNFIFNFISRFIF